MSSRNSIREKRRTARNMRLQSQRIGLIFLMAVILFGAGAFAIQFFSGEDSGGTTASGLKIEDLVVGSGPAAKVGDTVEVHYTGTFTDGSKFDSSLDRGQTFSFTIGAGGVIQGWEEGLVGMQVGGKRRLTVPPELGYGPNDYGPIPGNSTLIFEIELISIK